MEDRVARLRRDIMDNDDKLYNLKSELNRIEANCNHIWSTPIADHIYHKGYTDQGDPEGTMGVDRRLPCYIPARTDKRWKRVCSECGKVERTSLCMRDRNDITYAAEAMNKIQNIGMNLRADLLITRPIREYEKLNK